MTPDDMASEVFDMHHGLTEQEENATEGLTWFTLYTVIIIDVLIILTKLGIMK